MKIKRMVSILVGFALIAAAGIFFFFYRLGSNDARVLADFPAAYQKYDLAISAFSKAVVTSNPPGASSAGVLEKNADAALAELDFKASARISSLTRHDGAMMDTMLAIKDVSGKELETLKAYQQTAVSQSADRDRLVKVLADLTNHRQTDYAHFLELAGQNP